MYVLWYQRARGDLSRGNPNLSLSPLVIMLKIPGPDQNSSLSFLTSSLKESQSKLTIKQKRIYSLLADT